MFRLLAYLVAIALIASGLAWLADRPGTLVVNWQGYDIETSVFRAAIILAALVATGIFLWSVIKTIWNSPAILGDRILQKRKKKGLDALSGGMIAIGAGDKVLASRFALQARKALPHEPLTHLLRAQAADLAGDRATARRIYEAMLASPETEQLGLRGLFLEAEREGAGEAALQFAERAMKANPQLGWSSDALFDLQCRQKDWPAALETLAQGRRNGSIDKVAADRKRAVIQTALAQDLEDADPDKALALALEAHGLASELVPAAAIAGRIQASRGATSKAAKIIQKTWMKSPHPDLATAYAFARVGDSTRDRLDRVKKLAGLNPHSIESPIAIAKTAIEAHLYADARHALQPLLSSRLTQRVAHLMAQVEAGENGDKGKVREWLARAANAARDPVWMADGVISDHWEAVSPRDGRLDAFQWRVPVESRDPSQIELDASRLEALLAIGAPVAPSGASSGPIIEPEASVKPLANREAAEDAEAVTIRPVQRSASTYTPTSSSTATERATAPEAAEVSIRPAAPAASTRSPYRTQDRAQGQPQSHQPTRDGDAVSGPMSSVDVGSRSVDRPDRPTYPVTRKSPSAATAASDSKLFVSPRAPDDPGPDVGDIDPSASASTRPFKAAT